MVKVIAACSPLFVALTTAIGVAGQTSTPPTQQITVSGCVVRNGAVDVDKGVRQLDIAPNALALTNAKIVSVGNPRTSAVPGSVPDGAGSGTIPPKTAVGSDDSTTRNTKSF